MKLNFTHKVLIGTSLILTIMYIIYRRNLSSTAKKSIIGALSEYSFWNKKGIKYDENDNEVTDRILKYWKEGVGIDYSKNIPAARSTAWSAAFISYLMKKAGAGDKFKYAASHSVYIRDAIKNRKENNNNPFKGYKPEEVKVEVGDLVCYARNNSGANYNTTSSYESHCDLVTNTSKNKASSIGGNVSNSVTETIVPLTDSGKIDLSKTDKDYFVVIKNAKK